MQYSFSLQHFLFFTKIWVVLILTAVSAILTLKLMTIIEDKKHCNETHVDRFRSPSEYVVAVFFSQGATQSKQTGTKLTFSRQVAFAIRET